MLPDLPPTYVEHVVSPRGIGDIEGAHAAGEVGSMVGGLGVRVTLAYEAGANGHARIRRAAGRTFGSAAALAPLSWLTTALEGARWEEACAHTPEGVQSALGEGNGLALPMAVQRGAAFAVKALRRALGIARHGQPAAVDGEGILVCRCLGVGDRVIRGAIRAGDATPEAIGERTHACSGCRSCRPDLLTLIGEETTASPPTPPRDLHPAARITLARVGPLLSAQGLPLREAGVRENTVLLGLGEAGPGAALSPLGALALARHMLRELVADDVDVALRT